ncbi:zinc ABC transporter substrate-binding protein [Nocardioides sp.]|uniref:metal ABC transporter solute-binding protein, Zn/Mn family n=1 Tax=Nocardioides sp. TaxID=35761 RepID=UPI002611AF4F|nr:zinc ABC transporter substrate-binding protein [Nocardioides sp.]
MTLKTTLAAAAVAAVALTLTACGSSDSGTATKDASSSKGDTPISVVASTNVWGDIASQVGGDAVKVTSLISDPSQDPHSFEASATTALEIKKAGLVIENGGGYDDFVTQLLGTHASKAVVVDAVTVSGKTTAAGDDLNEHVWYDLPTAQKVADAIATELGKLDPSQAATFTANAKTFAGKVDTLIADEQKLKATATGKGVGITEPVPLYMTEAIGLVDKTPAAFSAAIEEGDDVAVGTLNQTLDLYRNHQVAVLVTNAQTSGPITSQVEKAAKAANIPVVSVTETMPEGQTYESWMQHNLDALSAALR